MTPPKPVPVLCRHCGVEIVQRDDLAWVGKGNGVRLQLCDGLGFTRHEPAEEPAREGA